MFVLYKSRLDHGNLLAMFLWILVLGVPISLIGSLLIGHEHVVGAISEGLVDEQSLLPIVIWGNNRLVSSSIFFGLHFNLFCQYQILALEGDFRMGCVYPALFWELVHDVAFSEGCWCVCKTIWYDSLFLICCTIS